MQINVSIGTAGVLGLAKVPMDAPPTAAYLMIGGRCAMNCAFCAQARDSDASSLALSRVTWPEYDLDAVCLKLRGAEASGRVRRCCVQVTAGPDHWNRTVHAVRRIVQAVTMPVNVAVLPANLEQVDLLVELGVDRIGFGLDAASERVFRTVKGGHWARVLHLIQETAKRHPGHAAVHLIVGLGETDRELLERVLWARELGVEVGLFAFTPVRGTALAGAQPPSMARYRRMQVACALILEDGAALSSFCFGDSLEGPDSLLKVMFPDWQRRVADGQAFRTRGCPDCNRPYYNERPGGDMYNYPRALGEAEVRACLAEAGLERSL